VDLIQKWLGGVALKKEKRMGKKKDNSDLDARDCLRIITLGVGRQGGGGFAQKEFHVRSVIVGRGQRAH